MGLNNPSKDITPLSQDAVITVQKSFIYSKRSGKNIVMITEIK